MMEELAARWVIVASMFFIAIFGLISVLPTPSGSPGYTRFLPLDLSLKPLVSGNRPGPVRSANVTGATAKVTVQSANCRAKPFGNSEKITILYRNQEAQILGRNADSNNPWWYVKIPNTSGNCWLWGMTTTTIGNVNEVPVVP